MSFSRPPLTTLPSRLPILPLRSGVVFPGTTVSLPVGRPRSVALLQSLSNGSILGVATQVSPSVADPARGDLEPIGTYVRLVEFVRGKDREYRVVLEGLGRFRLGELTSTEPYWAGTVEPIVEAESKDDEVMALGKELLHQMGELTARGRGAQGPITAPPSEPGLLADQVAGALGLESKKEWEIFSELDSARRLEQVAKLVGDHATVADVRRKIDGEVRKEIGKTQREAVLREQLRAIQRELGEDKGEADLQALKEKLKAAGLTEEAQAVADRELRRLEATPVQSPEHHVLRNYLETMADLPWSHRATTHDDVDVVASTLEADHYGLEDAKRRIVEHMAVLKVSGNPKGTLLCFAGPPGVGKTSLGQSIARATGRPFVRISLGGIRDEAEIRGHRRTYVGALPGRILAALRKAKAKNPVVLLDEIDKMGAGWAGVPEAALLEVLDPEQNRTFVDHYLDIPFDLSEVIFIATANTLETLSAPLRDRLEIIEVAGYTPEEKVHIAKRHLLPSQLKEHGLSPSAIAISDELILQILREHTREAGVRQLTRAITKLCRAAALETAKAKDEKPSPLVVDEATVTRILGRPKFRSEVAERTALPGVATGLAWTPVGGDILFVEASRMPGKGSLEITGQLGDVMKESARAALTYIRSHAEALGVDPRFLETSDLHIHVPAGGIPKDGPSAGVTMFTALTSLLTGRRVRPDTAMTGEVTLRGRVLPVGGIKAKVLAAHGAGLRRVILPKKNGPDLDEIPESARKEMEFILAEDMDEVLAAALQEEPLPSLEGAPNPVDTPPPSPMR